MRHLAWLISAFLLFACSDSSSTAPDAAPPKPAAPLQNDTRFTVSGIKKWYVLGNALTPAQTVKVKVKTDLEVRSMRAWTSGQETSFELTLQGDTFIGELDVSGLPAGEHQILLGKDGEATGFWQEPFTLSHPIYVVVSTDWDDADNPDISLEYQESIHQYHPEVVLTHLVGPYTFTDETLSAERRTLLLDWVKRMRDDFDDEIGLHIHAYCNFIETAEVPCRTEPSTVYATDPTGYTVMLNAYTEAELVKIFEKAKALFVENGLGTPTVFRAGGWIADAKVLSALATAGFVADSSANNWQYLEEWKDQQNGVLYEWNKENWSTITDTSQPYYPSTDDAQSSKAPTLDILEIPDNGILVDYVTAQEMIGVFTANFDGTPLEEPKVFSIGYHPPNFNTLYLTRLGDTFRHLEALLAKNHDGPVIFAKMSDITKVWPR